MRGFKRRTDEEYYEAREHERATAANVDAHGDGSPAPLRATKAKERQHRHASASKNKKKVREVPRRKHGNKQASSAPDQSTCDFVGARGVLTFDHAYSGIPYFSPVNFVPRDLMHVELEGTLKAHLFGLLYMAICKYRWFTLEAFNAALKSWNFGPGVRRPDPLHSKPKGVELC